MKTDNPYLRHTAQDRLCAKRLAPDENQTIRQEGLLADVLNFISREQLCDRALWKKFVDQFRAEPDGRKGEWRCEYWGKMMRGAAYVYSVTRDAELGAVLHETVRELLSVQEPDGRYSTYPRDAEFRDWDMWGRKYILLGLLCYRKVCDDDALRADILTAAQRHADYILARVGEAREKKIPISQTALHRDTDRIVHGAMNSLSVLEPMVLLFRLTGEKRYLDFSTYLVEEGSRACGNIFELAAEDRLNPYQYRYTKAYELMSCFEGLLEYALTVHSEKWKQAAIRFAYRMAHTDVTVMGGAGTAHEFLNHSALQQAVPAERMGQETCVTVTWMKLCARMLFVTGDPLFADCLEQSLYNAYLGAVNREKKINSESFAKGFLIPGVELVPSFLPFDSYTPLHTGRRGSGIGGSLCFADGTYYGCCACIGSMGIGMAPHMAVLRAETGFSVQLYAPGSYETATQAGVPVSFLIAGGYPAQGAVTVRVSPEQPARFTVSLRIPSWSLHTAVAVNGEHIPVTPGITEISREWSRGDEISLVFDFRTEALRPTRFESDVLRGKIDWLTFEMTPEKVTEPPEYAGMVAFRRGPLMLASDARLGNAGEPLALPAGDSYVPEEPDSGEIPTDRKSVRVTLRLPDGTDLRLMDCAAAGSTWDQSSAFAVWLPGTAKNRD